MDVRTSPGPLLRRRSVAPRLIVALAATASILIAPGGARRAGAIEPLLQVGAGTVMTGRVLETMNAGGYTYVRVDTADGELWAAGPQIAVKVGDTVSFPAGMPMTGFRSKTLDRTFDRILFVSAIRVGSGARTSTPDDGAGAPHAGLGKAPPSSIDLSGIEAPEGGVTISAIYGDSGTLAGTEVLIRARVVKSNSGIMGRNWLHVRDGTEGPGGENDLTVTTSGTANVGDTVLVRGKLTVDKDFGFGYRYDVIVEDAKVTVENGTADKT